MAIQWFLSARRFAAVYGAFAPLLIVAAAPPDSCSPTVSCVDDPRVSKTATGLEKQSAQGTFKVRIESAIPNPPARYTNTWVIRIFDASGAAIVGARVVPDLFMPDHNHYQPPPVVTANANGTYSVTGFELAMPGIFQVIFKLPDRGTDSVSFYFCV
ncbi:MAG TPA: hypothetical protein VI072_06305, partial [Polyangiaceae bacterium]